MTIQSPRPVRVIGSPVEWTDGSEDELLGILASARDVSAGSDELARYIRDWPTRYHLSRARSHLLRPLRIEAGMRILEVGAGSGVHARFLGELGAEVTALEGSLERARAAAVRCRDLPNVEILCGPIDALDDAGPFDLVVAVGVLEYAETFGDGPDQTEAFLRRLSDLGGSEGAVALTIENRLGLKYLLGCAEDHLGITWIGIEGYPVDSKVRTYSKAGLQRLLAKAGLKAQHWLYAFPDYKHPSVLLTDAAYGRPHVSQFVDQLVLQPVRDFAHPRLLVADDRLAHETFVDAGLGPEVANSFVVVAAQAEEALGSLIDRSVVAWHFGSERLREWMRVKAVAERGKRIVVESRMAWPGEVPRTRGWLRQDGEGTRAYVIGPTVEQLIRRACYEGDTAEVVRLLGEWKEHLDSLASRREQESKPPHPFIRTDSTALLPPDHLDVELRNFVVRGSGVLSYVDSEWEVAEGVDRDLACIRALWYLAEDLVNSGIPHPWPASVTVDELAEMLADAIGLVEGRNLLEPWRTAEGELQELVHGTPANETERSLIEKGRRTREDLALGRELPFSRLAHERVRIAAELSEREWEVEDLQRVLAEVRGQLSARAEEVESYQRVLAEVRGQLSERESQLSERESQLSEQTAESARLRAHVDALVNSTTWRLMAPIRRTLDRLPRLKRILAGTLRTLYRASGTRRLRARRRRRYAERTALALVDTKWLAEFGGSADRYTQSHFEMRVGPNEFIDPEFVQESNTSVQSAGDLLHALPVHLAAGPPRISALAASGWASTVELSTPENLRNAIDELRVARSRLGPQGRASSVDRLPTCDIVIPVFNAPDLVERCVRTLFTYTPAEHIEAVYLADDGSDEVTRSLLRRLREEFGCVVLDSDVNRGYTRNVNEALGHTTADAVLLLNSDCMVSRHTIRNLLASLRSGPSVALVSPLADLAPPVSMRPLPGRSHVAMEALLSNRAPGATYDACTIVGNCLMISRQCLEAIGGFAEEWGQGYGEETDYQFRAMQAGFQALIAADGFVHHEGGGSFGDTDAAETLRSGNYARFMEKWGQQYLEELNRYRDPVRDWELLLLAERDIPKVNADVVFVLPALRQTIGGTMLVLQLAEQLLARGVEATIALPHDKRPDLGKPTSVGIIELPPSRAGWSDLISADIVVATHWTTVDLVESLARTCGAQTLYLIQGFEPWFSAAESFADVVSSYERIRNRVVISDWLGDRVHELARGEPPEVVVFGPDSLIFYPLPSRSGTPSIGFMLRSSVDKGDAILVHVAHRVTTGEYPPVRVRVLDPVGTDKLRPSRNLEIVRGPLTRRRLAEELRDTDIWIDASLHEGYGRLAVEAMASGAAAIVTDSGGSREYSVGEGCAVVAHMDPDAILAQVDEWLKDPEALARAKAAAATSARERSFSDGVEDFARILERTRRRGA